MDAIDERILDLLVQNARMPVKEIASRISLTAPAVSQRIHRLEKKGVIAGYTLRLAKPQDSHHLCAFINILSLSPAQKTGFLKMIAGERQVERCCNVTGSSSYLIFVRCDTMEELEKLLGRLQKWGQTNTQIVLSTPIDRIS